MPYEISTMSLFEQYSAGIPLFLPTKELLLHTLATTSMHFNSIKSYRGGPYPGASGEYHTSLTDQRFWVELADYYDKDNYKYIYYYSSFGDLIKQLENFTDVYREERLSWIAERNKKIMNDWREAVSHLFE